MIMVTFPPNGPLPCGTVMSIRILGGEKNHFPVFFMPSGEVLEKSAENGCGICANADGPKELTTTMKTKSNQTARPTRVDCFIEYSFSLSVSDVRTNVPIPSEALPLGKVNFDGSQLS
jgi:hypothetical protein